MPIITISRGSYSKGKEVAEKAAEKLGYKIISRDIMLGASEEFDVPEIRLVRAIHDARVTAKGGSVFIESSAILSQHYRAAHDIKDIVKNIPGTKSIHVVVKPVLPITG